MNILSKICHNYEFRRRLEESRERLYRVAYSWHHDPALADDLVQETLSKALRRSGQLRDPNALEPWLFRILTNCWRDYFRRRKESVDVDDLVLVEETTPESSHHRMEVISRVRAAIATLPVGQRQVLTLVELEDFSYIEVAQILEIPIGTVMSRLCRARRALKDVLLSQEARRPDSVTRIRRVK